MRDEASPDPRDADELHDALLSAGFLTERDARAIAPELSRALFEARRACEFRIQNSEFRILVAAERLRNCEPYIADAVLDPPIVPPASRAARAWTRDEAIVELLRGRVSILGPTTAAALARDAGIDIADADAALLALESEGLVLRGQFTPRSPTEGRESFAHSASEIAETGKQSRPLEWCERRLLARIHRYTLNRLRAEIEPVSPADFMRFLFTWQHVQPASRLAGIDGVRAVLECLDGFELAAEAWERAILPDRVEGFQPSMLDTLCLTGETGWARLSSPSRDTTQMVGATPIALFRREHADAWTVLKEGADDADADVRAADERLDPPARTVLAMLRSRGASFVYDLVTACGLDDAAVRGALGDLVAAGLVTSDGFGGLRTIVRTTAGRPHVTRNNVSGRWSILSSAGGGCSRETAIELQARTLLRRYGIVFRRLLAREANVAPWRELTRVYRRLEARGEIRGGRFVSGMAGEQFALADAIERLREIRRTPADGRCVVISAADPLNLAGIVTAGERVRAVAGSRVAYRNGVPLAALEGDYVRPLIELTDVAPALASEVASTLTGRPMPPVLSGFVGRS